MAKKKPRPTGLIRKHILAGEDGFVKLDETVEMCLAETEDHLQCTRRKGHTGWHCAHASNALIVARWPQISRGTDSAINTEETEGAEAEAE